MSTISHPSNQPIIDPADPFPLVGEVAARMWGYATHPAVSVRSMVLNR